VAEDAIPLVAAPAEVVLLRLLVAPRNAARMTLGGVHLGTPALEPSLLVRLCLGVVNRPAHGLFAVRSHRSSVRSKLPFSPAYHVTTG
jgi:hypothetical protein